MTETSLQVVAAIKEKDFWKTARWVSYTNKYNERFISYEGPGTGPWNIPVCNLDLCLRHNDIKSNIQKIDGDIKFWVEVK